MIEYVGVPPYPFGQLPRVTIRPVPNTGKIKKGTSGVSRDLFFKNRGAVSDDVVEREETLECHVDTVGTMKTAEEGMD